MKHIININNTMNDNDKIMNIISKVFNATSPETAVSLEQVIEKGIELGVAEDYSRGKEDDHNCYRETQGIKGVR